MKTQNPWMGRAKGSAGGITASKVYDKNVLKAKAFEVNNPNTAAQQNQRTFFKEVSNLVNQLTEEQCRFLCPKAPKGMSRRNFLSKQLASYVTTSSNQKVVDLANVTTLGNAKEANITSIEGTIDDNELMLYWDSSDEWGTKHENEYLTFFVINVSKKQVFMINSDQKIKDDNFSTSNFPEWNDGDTLKVIPLSTGATTPLTGFGTMIAAERPKK